MLIGRLQRLMEMGLAQPEGVAAGACMPTWSQTCAR